MNTKLKIQNVRSDFNMQQKESKTNSHFYISIVKSIVRFIAGGFLIAGDTVVAGTAIIAAEVLGILEEL